VPKLKQSGGIDPYAGRPSAADICPRLAHGYACAYSFQCASRWCCPSQKVCMTAPGDSVTAVYPSTYTKTRGFVCTAPATIKCQECDPGTCYNGIFPVDYVPETAYDPTHSDCDCDESFIEHFNAGTWVTR
jgi:hypothetical protein